MSVRGGFGIWERWCEVGGWAVVTVVRSVGTTVSPIVVLPRVVLEKAQLRKKERLKECGFFKTNGLNTVSRACADSLPGGYCRFCGYCRFYY